MRSDFPSSSTAQKSGGIISPIYSLARAADRHDSSAARFFHITRSRLLKNEHILVLCREMYSRCCVEPAAQLTYMTRVFTHTHHPSV